MLQLVLMLLAVLVHQAQADCGRIVCYHTNWSQYRPGEGKFLPENIDPNLCTHIHYAFAKITNNAIQAFEWNDESTDWMVGMYTKFQKAKQANPSVKTLIAVGGWNMGTQAFTQVVASAGSRKQFIDSAVAFIKKNGFDGLDLDWEYPANRGSPAQDRGLFTTFVKELRQAFDANGHLLLSAAVAAGKSNIDTAYEIPEISKYLDYISLMTYDLHGSWETHTGENSPLFSMSSEQGDDKNLNIAWAANYWVQKGAPKGKLNIGLGTYGRSFTLSNPSNNGVYAPATQVGTAGTFTREGGFLAYYEICKMIKSGGVVHDDKEQGVPYVVQGNQWVGYDNPASLQQKVRYIKSNGFGGVMIWALDLDDFSGTQCGEGKYPLLNAIHHECGNTNVAPVTQAPEQHTQAPDHHTQEPGHHTQAPVTQRPGGGHGVSKDDGFHCSGKDDGFYADPSSCVNYYMCAAGVSYKVQCASGLIYNDNTDNCDLPSNFACTKGEVPNTPEPNTQQPQTEEPHTQAPHSGGDTTNFCKDQSDGIHADPNSCNHFFECANHATYHLPCGPGTVFHAEIQTCDRPENVPNC